MQFVAARRRDRIVDRRPRQLVPKRDEPVINGDKHAPGEAGIDRRGRRPGDVDQHMRRNRGVKDGCRIENLPSIGRQSRCARQHGIADRRRNRSRDHFAGQHLAGKKGIAAGEAMQRRRIEPVTPGIQGYERLDAGFGKRLQSQPAGRRRGRQIAKHDANRMVGPRLIVTIGDQQQRPRQIQPAAEKSQQIDGRLIGPLDILDDHHRRDRSVVQLGQRGAKHPVARGIFPQQPVELAPD